jgi:hypothetical protein
MVVLFFFLQDREKSWKTRWTDGENGKELRTYQIVELLERKREKEQKILLNQYKSVLGLEPKWRVLVG